MLLNTSNNWLKILICSLSLTAMFGLFGCKTTSSNLYKELGGQPKIVEITDYFIDEISYNPEIADYFKNTNINRFRDKLNEHLCMVVQGPCVYTGDTMLLVHKGMNINETHFNLMVELLINAMNRADISHTIQNKLIARLAPMRKEIIYH